MLKYVSKDSDGAWNFTMYFDYLNSIKARVPIGLRDPICNKNRYDLGRESFHDAWLISLTLQGPQESDPQDVFTIKLILLGPYHDRLFELTYLSAATYRIELAAGLGPTDKITYHGAMKRKDDLMVHEFDVSEKGSFSHRLLFDSGMAISITCSDIRFEERMIEDVETEI